MDTIKLNNPRSVYVHNNDQIYIADTDNHRIRRIYNSKIVTIAGTGEAGYNGDSMDAKQAKINTPMCVIVSKSGIYFSDYGNHRIRKIDKRGIISTIVGCGESGYSGDGGLAIKAKLNSPCGICLSNDGKFLFIADRSNYVIRKVSLLNGIIETIAGNGTNGQISHGSLAVKSNISGCFGIAISKDNELYFSELLNYTIRKIDKNGYIMKIAGIEGKYGYGGENMKAISTLLDVPAHICFDNENNLIFSDRNNSKVRKINLNTGLINTIAYESTKCYGCFVNINSNELYITETDNSHRIKKINLNTNITTIIAGGTGERGYSGDSEYFTIFDTKLKKYERDRIFNTEIIGFIPLLKKLTPNFVENILRNEQLLQKMNSTQHAIIQQLIEELIYGGKSLKCNNNDELFNIISVIGLVNGNDFMIILYD